MSAIRVAVQSNLENADGIAAIVEGAAAVRAEPGCLHYELFQSMEYPENLVQIELWQDEAAFDRHWQAVQAEPARGGLLAGGDARLCAPHHYGTPRAPRRTGENGIEIYPIAPFGRAPDGTWQRTGVPLIESVRWPARSGVRIILQLNLSGEAERSALAEMLTTREEPGCLQFEYFRGVEFPENTLLMELWKDPEIFDLHHLRRLRDDIFSDKKRPARAPIERRYGDKSFEWYQHNYFCLVDSIWQPERPEERSNTVRW